MSYGLSKREAEPRALIGPARVEPPKAPASLVTALRRNSRTPVTHLDPDRALIRAQAGITWPELIRAYVARQQGREIAWGIRQKQTGADRLTSVTSARAAIICSD